MKPKKILSFVLIMALMMTIFVIPVTAAESEQLTNNSTISSNSIVVNDSITLNAAGSGGTAPYTYAYYYKNTSVSTWTTLKNYSSVSSIDLTLSTVGSYNVCIKVKDTAGEIVKKYFEVSVSNGVLISKSYLSSSNIYLGETVALNGVGIGGTAPYTYAFYYKNVNTTGWTCLKYFSSTNSVDLMPNDVGTYDVCIKVHDSTGTEHKKYYKLTVERQPFSVDFSVDKRTMGLGESVTLTGIASGGTSPYTYAFYYKLTENENWTCLKGFTATNSISFKPNIKGAYNICIKSKDADNTLQKEYFELYVSDALSSSNCGISSEHIMLGESVSMFGIGRYGSAPYKYAFYYKLNEESSWTQARGFSDVDNITVTPDTAGIYDMCIKVRDAANTISKKYFTLEVEEPGINVHFYNYYNWQNVKIYYYDDNGEYVPWTGVNMTADGDHVNLNLS